MRPPSLRSEHAARLLVAVAAVVFGATHAWIAGMTWRSLRSAWPLDLAYFHQQVWSVSRGAGFAQSVHWHESQSLVGNTHFNPIILLGVPLQWVWPGLDALLVVQCALVALGGVGIYRLAASHGAGPYLGLGCTLMFYGSAPLWRVTQSDVRPLVWSVPFLLLLAAALSEARRREAVVWACLACLCREELPVIVAFLALAHSVGWGPVWRRRFGTAAVIVGVAAGIWAAAVLVRPASDTYIEPGMWLLESLGWPLSLPRGVGPDPVWVQRFGDRVVWLVAWAWPVGLIALGGPRLLAGALPLLGYLLTTDVAWADWDGEGPHYTAPAVAFVGGAAAVAVGRLAGRVPTSSAPFFGAPRGAGSGKPMLAAGVVIAVLSVQCVQAVQAWGGWLQEHTQSARVGDAEVRALSELAAVVPPDAPVMADFTTVHLFAGRAALYCYQRDAMQDHVGPDAPGELLPGRDPQPQWALIATRHPRWIARAAERGLVERGRERRFVLYGPPPQPVPPL